LFSLILGGNKSGKSDMGLKLLQKEKGSCCLVVTGKAADLEFNEQIRRHKADRHPGIPVVEADAELGQCLRSLHFSADAVLVDSVDFWVFNVFTKKHPEAYINDFFSSLEAWRDKRLILVSAEIGLGPLPSSGFTRRFTRLLGEVNQGLAAMCEDVTLIVAGLPVRIR
jgi:adenosylcobinamide kinase / adenosylcobinamide-phosphate guanylyltransferase